MKYTVKWVEDNLGITRKALRHYEEKGLLSADASRNPINNYREYDEKYIDRIWSIKILQGIGYSIKEIRALMDDTDVDFYESISEKVVELEKKRNEVLRYIEFAKTIKLTGRVPTTKQVSSIRYEDFMNYSRENWNFYLEPKVASYLNVMDELILPEEREWSDADIDRLEGLAELLADFQENQMTCTVNAYYKIISEMYHMGYRSESVQLVVRLLYDFLSEQEAAKEIGEKYTPQFFAKYTALFFCDGSDIGKMHASTYGEDGSKFIANAIAYFGGFETLEDLYE